MPMQGLVIGSAPMGLAALRRGKGSERVCALTLRRATVSVVFSGRDMCRRLVSIAISGGST